MYWQYGDARSLVPDEDELNRKKLQDFYRRALRPYVMDGAVMYEHLTSQCLKHITDFQLVATPSVTFDEYLKLLGYFDDMKKLYK